MEKNKKEFTSKSYTSASSHECTQPGSDAWGHRRGRVDVLGRLMVVADEVWVVDL